MEISSDPLYDGPMIGGVLVSANRPSESRGGNYHFEAQNPVGNEKLRRNRLFFNIHFKELKEVYLIKKGSEQGRDRDVEKGGGGGHNFLLSPVPDISLEDQPSVSFGIAFFFLSELLGGTLQ